MAANLARQAHLPHLRDLRLGEADLREALCLSSLPCLSSLSPLLCLSDLSCLSRRSLSPSLCLSSCLSSRLCSSRWGLSLSLSLSLRSSAWPFAPASRSLRELAGAASAALSSRSSGSALERLEGMTTLLATRGGWYSGSGWPMSSDRPLAAGWLRAASGLLWLALRGGGAGSGLAEDVPESESSELLEEDESLSLPLSEELSESDEDDDEAAAACIAAQADKVMSEHFAIV